MTQRAWASVTSCESSVSGGNELNQYFVSSASFSAATSCVAGSSGGNDSSVDGSAGTGRSASNQPSGPVWTRLWLVLWRGEPVAQWTRIATTWACIVPLV